MSQLENSIREIVRECIAAEMAEAHRTPEPLLSAEQVGALLGGIDKQAVYRLKREGHLKPVYLSETRFMFHPAEVQRFIQSGGVKPCQLTIAPRKVSRGGAR